MLIVFRIIFLALIFSACSQKKEAVPAKPLTKEEMIAVNIDSLKRTARSCDMIVREGDDLISAQIRFMNDKEKEYSHAGLIIERNGQKYVCHIAPGISPADTIQYIPIDSFVDPKTNIKCALYRFDLSDAERDSIGRIIETYRQQDVRFDRRYDLNTTDKMYCTEMIYRAFKQATNNRIDPKLANIPKRMFNVLLKYFAQEKATPGILSKMKIVTVDNVYLVPQGSLVMAFPVKYFPGQ